MNEFRLLVPFIHRYLPLLLVALALLVFSGLFDALIVILLEPIFNDLAPGAARTQGDGKFNFVKGLLGLETENQFVRIAVLLVLFAFLKGFFLYFAEYLMSYSGQRVVASLRKKLNRGLLDQSMAFFSSHPTGKLMARVITDTERLQETVSKTLTDFTRQIILLTFFLAIVFYIDWKLALLSFLVAPLVLSITVNLGQRIRRVTLHSQENLAEISHSLQETISGSYFHDKIPSLFKDILMCFSKDFSFCYVKSGNRCSFIRRLPQGIITKTTRKAVKFDYFFRI